jgi:autotransporter-associated beta strand protein
MRLVPKLGLLVRTRYGARRAGPISAGAGRCLLLACAALSAAPHPAAAQDATWKTNPGSNNFNTGSNWSSGTVPTGTAFFGTSNLTNLTFSAFSTTVGGWTFNTGASNYIFTLSGQHLTFSGAGIVVNGGSAAILNGSDVITFNNASTAGNAAISNGGGVQFFATSTAGKATITNNDSIIFANSSTAANANILNTGNIFKTGTILFQDSSSAGSALIASNATSIIRFGSFSTAGNATITISGIGGSGVFFSDFSTAGNATITSSGATGITFDGSSTAGNATIANGSFMAFNGASTAGNASITNSSNTGVTFGGSSTAGNASFTNTGSSSIEFSFTSSAGSATITNNGNSSTFFTDGSTAGNATITNNGNSSITLASGSTAGNATITNNSNNINYSISFFRNSTAGNATITNNGGIINFKESSTAGNATIINNSNGSISFFDSGTAGNAVITNNSAFIYFNGFFDTAGNAIITNNSNSSIRFDAGSTAGNATITNNSNSSIIFVFRSTGGNAAIINNSNSIVDFSGSTGPANDGRLSVGSLAGAGNFYLGQGQLAVGGNNLSTTVSGVISDCGAGGTACVGGATGGSLLKVGTGTLTLSGTNTYTGATGVDGGTLMVNGSIAASRGVTVDSGGTLAGTGTVSSTVVNSGGMLAPGNSNDGTLNVAGNLTFNAGSTFLVFVTPTTSSRANVTGSASLAGTVEAVFLPGSYLTNAYVILSATGGRTGTFDNLVTVGLPAFLTAKLTYDPNDVMLVTLNSNLNRPGLTQNQSGVAAALDNSFNTGHGTLNGLSFVGANQLPAALSALSGEGTSGTQEAAFGAGTLFLGAMMEQGQFWRAGTGIGATYAPMGYAPDPSHAPVFKAMPLKAPPVGESPYRAWFAGFDGAWHLDGEAGPGSASLSHNTVGGAAGIDYLINSDVLIGAAAGGSQSTFSVADRATGGTLDGAHIGTYGVARWQAWYAAGALAFNAFDNKVSRTIAGVGPRETATGTFNSEMVSGRFELGYRQVFGGFAVTPFAALQFAELWQSGYSESSTTLTGTPGVLGLTYASQKVSSLPSFLGAQFDTRVVLANGTVWMPFARLSWVHELEPTRDVSGSFIALPVTDFTVFGPSAARDAGRIDIGSTLAIGRNTSVFASFDGEFSDRSQMYAGRSGIKITW